MRRVDAELRLRHMLDAAREIRQLIHGRTRADMDADRLLELAVVRLLEVLGEAAARVPAAPRRRPRR